MPLVNFEKFDLNQLKQISHELAGEIERRTEEERQKAAMEIKKIANALGMTVEQILTEKKPKRGRKPKAKEEQVVQVVPEAMTEVVSGSPAESPEPEKEEKEETAGKPTRKGRKK
jgi:hypothetical protein